MLMWISAGVASLLAVAVVVVAIRLRNRRKFYRRLAASRESFCHGKEPRLCLNLDSNELVRVFKEEHLVRVEGFVDGDTLERLRAEGLSNLERGIRSYIPTHKKGRSLPYEQLHYHAPSCLAFYHSPEVKKWVESVVGEKVHPAGDHDQSACSILYYDQPGDHIQWHFDHNFYKGRQFTVLLSLVNKSKNGGLSNSNYVCKKPDGSEHVVDTSENALVVFEGSRVLHKASPTKEGDFRMVLSMTYNTEPKIGWFMETIRRGKDVAFHGLRTIWN